MNTFRYILGVLLVVGVPPGLSWWFIVHPFVGFGRGMGVRLTMAVMIVYFAAGVAGLVLIRDQLLGPDFGTQWALVAIGALLAIGSMFIAIRRRKYLTTRILAGIPELQIDPDEQGELIDAGPYAVIRHPRYVEIILATFAYAAVANYLGSWIVAVLAVPVTHLVVILEESELAERFGQAYHDYAARVPRYFPRLRGQATDSAL